VGRARSTDQDKTTKRQIDVAKAFADADDAPDAVPVLRVPRAELPWNSLGDLATKLLLRVDGSTTTRQIATAAGTLAPPEACAREMSALARRGLLELKSVRDEPAAQGEELELELDIDLSQL
jgi:hypothetical protein